ncbi:hypothetical protein LEMLEM_LOCUS12798, partial [Lemmus lemmus]
MSLHSLDSGRSLMEQSKAQKQGNLHSSAPARVASSLELGTEKPRGTVWGHLRASAFPPPLLKTVSTLPWPQIFVTSFIQLSSPAPPPHCNLC